MLPNLDDDWTDRIDGACRTFLYEQIQFKPAASTYAGVRATVDYSDAEQTFNGAQVVTQAIRVSLIKVDVPAKPKGTDRITLKRSPGNTFKPVNVASDSSGTHWEFDLEAVSG